MAALAIAGLVVFGLRPNSPDDEVEAQRGAVDGTAVAELVPNEAAPDSAFGLATTRAKRPPSDRRRSLDAARARALREALIRAAKSRADAGPAGGAVAPAERAPPSEPPPSTLSREYIQSAVQALQPLIRECYELALDQDPKLRGKLVTHFSIIGDPELGGVVESSELIADRSTVRHPVLEECVKETMYAIELPAPEHGGRVEVHYPFVFDHADEDDRTATSAAR